MGSLAIAMQESKGREEAVAMAVEDFEYFSWLERV